MGFNDNISTLNSRQALLHDHKQAINNRKVPILARFRTKVTCGHIHEHDVETMAVLLLPKARAQLKHAAKESNALSNFEVSKIEGEVDF